MDSEKRKYPKGLYNNQCIGPCYRAGTWIVHPLTLEYITDNHNSFCPVSMWEHVDEKTGVKTERTTDRCYPPTETKDLSKNEFEMNILIPNIDFSDEQFLKIFYDIHSFEDAMNWINEKKYTALLTRTRVMNCALNAYGATINIIDYRMVEFFIELAKKKWINDIYKKVNKYIHISDDNKVMLGNPEQNNLSQTDQSVIRINFLIDRFINNDEIYKFLVRYLKHRKDTWDEITNHISRIKTDLIKYIINKINLTIS